MIRPTPFLFSVLAILSIVPAFVAGQRVDRNFSHNFEGIWNSGTATPLERPRELENKAFFTPAEAAVWERDIAEKNEEAAPDAKRTGTGTYNTFYREFGTRVVKTLRTSIVID